MLRTAMGLRSWLAAPWGALPPRPPLLLLLLLLLLLQPPPPTWALSPRISLPLGWGYVKTLHRL
ncbi:semaphorin 4B [Homo sapiens]|uniref:Semaphorin 4B n=1 Tax=Homo sapiens TaxID=9606 RepID=H0YM68_HUMAN|nr:semaphorin 4B [Homo sapiens]KAI4059434.1 semaphorin 4B [Homo sapiens]